MTVDVRPADDLLVRVREATVRWVPVCPVASLEPDRGVAALIRGEQVAIFLLSDPQEIYAVDNCDPYSGANVMARGLVGSVGDRPVVASPLYKERFDLADGTCLDGDQGLRTWSVRIVADWVEVGEVPEAV
jgi:nitrite reductase (NADH) small subunit